MFYTSDYQPPLLSVFHKQDNRAPPLNNIAKRLIYTYTKN